MVEMKTRCVTFIIFTILRSTCSTFTENVTTDREKINNRTDGHSKDDIGAWFAEKTAGLTTVLSGSSSRINTTSNAMGTLSCKGDNFTFFWSKSIFNADSFELDFNGEAGCGYQFENSTTVGIQCALTECGSKHKVRNESIKITTVANIVIRRNVRSRAYFLEAHQFQGTCLIMRHKIAGRKFFIGETLFGLFPGALPI